MGELESRDEAKYLLGQINGFRVAIKTLTRERDEALAREAVLAGALEKIRDCAPFHRHRAWMSPEGLHKIADNTLASVSDRAKQMLEVVEAAKAVELSDVFIAELEQSFDTVRGPRLRRLMEAVRVMEEKSC